MLAYGARRSRRRFSGVLEPFAVIEVALRTPRAGLWGLAEGRLVASFPGLLGSLEAMNAAGRALELVRRLAADGVSETHMFDETVRMLAVFEDADARRREAGLDCFMARILMLAGVFPNLSVCGGCGRAPRAGQPVQLHPQRAHVVCRACGGATILVGGAARALIVQAGVDGITGTPELGWPDDVVAGQIRDALSAVVRLHGR